MAPLGDGPSAPLPISRQQICDRPRVLLPEYTGTGETEVPEQRNPWPSKCLGPLTLSV